MSHVGKLVLLLPFLFTISCSEQDPEITSISSLSIDPKLQNSGPYTVNDSHFTTNYEISGECSKEVTDLQVQLSGSSWKSLTELLPASDSDCSNETFNISFKLDQIGFTMGSYEERSILLKTLSGKKESEVLELEINYPAPALETPTIDSISYVSNTELTINWSLPSVYSNTLTHINLETGLTASDSACQSGLSVAATTSGNTNLVSGNGITAFDLSSTNVVISICGENSEGTVSPQVTSVFYMLPGTPTAFGDYGDQVNDTEYVFGSISGANAVLFDVTYAATPTPSPPCPASTTGVSTAGHTIPNLTPDTEYEFRICAYNQNTPAQVSDYTYVDRTKRSQPTIPGGSLTLVRDSGGPNLKLLGLEAAKEYFIDIQDQEVSLQSDYTLASDKNITGVTSHSMPVAANKKYYVRVWAFDNGAYPKISEPYNGLAEYSYVKLVSRHSNSYKWGYNIQNSVANPHNLSNFTADCTETYIDAMDRPTECVNAGLLWFMPVIGSNVCSDYKVEVINTNTSEEVPFLWKCEGTFPNYEFQIIGTKNDFEIKDLVTSSSFVPLTVKLKIRAGGYRSEGYINQTLWTNPILPVNSTSSVNYTSAQDNHIIYLQDGHTGPVSLNGVSNATVVYEGENFNSTSGSNLVINNSKNIFIEINASNSAGNWPLKVQTSKNITLSSSKLFGSNQPVQFTSSNFIKINHSNFMDFQTTSALNISASNNLYLTNLKVSNSKSGIVYSSFLTEPVKINISQSLLAGIGNVKAAIDIQNSDPSSSFIYSNLNHITSKDNAFDSFYINAIKHNHVSNQILAIGTDIDQDMSPDSYGLFASYEDSSSTFNFSQLGYKNFIQNIDLKNNISPANQTPPQYNFENSYLDGGSNYPCELRDIGGYYGQCTLTLPKTDNFSFGELESPLSSKTGLTPNDWFGTTKYQYWLNGLVTCESSQTCTLYSTILDRSTSNLFDRSLNYTTPYSNNTYNPTNGEFIDSANCNDTLRVEAQYSAPEGIKKYLANAAEINTDMIGNNNGLCEEGEICVLSPNLGAYQGHFDASHTEYEKCDYTPSTVTAEVLAYPLNGKL